MSWAVLLEAAEAVRAAVSARDPRATGLSLAGIGWATVDHERAIRQLDELLGAGRVWTATAPDEDLGARAWVRGPGDADDAPALVVLEPNTEGRLAASLARFGEGVAVVYLGVGRPGPGTLAQGASAWGPHAVLLDPLGQGE